jgi:hypothetical protein
MIFLQNKKIKATGEKMPILFHHRATEPQGHRATGPQSHREHREKKEGVNSYFVCNFGHLGL